MAQNDRPSVADVMTTPIETISRTATVREAAAAMRAEDINALLVRGSEPGIVTSSDVLDAVAAGDDLNELRVEDVMTAPVETVPPTLTLQEAAAMMTSLGIQHLPVVTDDPVGMVSATDLAGHLS